MLAVLIWGSLLIAVLNSVRTRRSPYVPGRSGAAREVGIFVGYLALALLCTAGVIGGLGLGPGAAVAVAFGVMATVGTVHLSALTRAQATVAGAESVSIETDRRVPPA
jgi:hypothetical protein